MKYTAIIPSLMLAGGLSHAVPTLAEHSAKSFVCSSIGRQLWIHSLTLSRKEDLGSAFWKSLPKAE